VADVVDFNDKPMTEEALEHAMAWVDVARDSFDETTIDFVALDGVAKVLHVRQFT
jgi:hypothetical protein